MTVYSLFAKQGRSRRRIIKVLGLMACALVAMTLFLRPILRRHFESVSCSNQMHAILYACVLEWPDEHNGQLPADFQAMSNELDKPWILICPGDHLRPVAANWNSLTTNNCSYEILAPGIHKGQTNIPFLRCKVHGYVGYADDRMLDKSGRVVKPERFW